MQSVLELTDKILSLTVAHPKPCQNSVRRLITTRDGIKKISVLFDSIGLEYSKQLFDRIPASQWKMIQEFNKNTSARANQDSAAKILLEIYTDFLIESMSSDSPDYTEDPFSFLKEFNSYELSSILGKEDPTQIAFISLHWTPEEMAHLLSCLTPPMRRQVVLQILRLERVPEDALERAAVRFASQIKRRFHGLFDEPDSTLSDTQRDSASSAHSSPLEYYTDSSDEADSSNDTDSILSIVAEIDLDAEQKMLDYIKSKSTSIKLQFKDQKDY